MGFYLVFCLTTAVHAAWGLLTPVILKLKEEQPENPLVANKFLTYLVFICLATILAPVLLIPCIIPSFEVAFKNSLYSSVKD